MRWTGWIGTCWPLAAPLSRIQSSIGMQPCCYNFLRHITVGPASNYVGWPAQLLESRLNYFVLDVTLTADSGLGFHHLRSCQFKSDAFGITPFFALLTDQPWRTYSSPRPRSLSTVLCLLVFVRTALYHVYKLGIVTTQQTRPPRGTDYDGFKGSRGVQAVLRQGGRLGTSDEGTSDEGLGKTNTRA
jgi:hypothetical protein